MDRVRVYYRLSKPGIIYSNVITAAAGYFLAARGHVQLVTLLGVVIGSALVIASACVINNVTDRSIDRKMERTKNRSLVHGEVSVRAACIYAAILGVTGFISLGICTNFIVVLIGLIGVVDYVALYAVGKRQWVAGTLIGSISGAASIVAGYCAVTARFDLGAFLLFMIMVCWQMPHFYAIAMYRRDDYAAAGLPVLPVIHGLPAAKRRVISYIVAYTAATALITVCGYAGYSYLGVSLLLGGWWLVTGVRLWRRGDDVLWARKMFFSSLVVILGLSAALSVGSLLP